MFQMEIVTVKKTKLIHYVDFIHTTYFLDEGTHESEHKHYSKHKALWRASATISTLP
jgi:aspartyl/asparaginyl beta-hydroxylase (cupin superfamily)